MSLSSSLIGLFSFLTNFLFFYECSVLEKCKKMTLCECVVATWSGDSMNVSKLALFLLIPDLGQLGYVHLHRIYSSDWKKRRGTA